MYVPVGRSGGAHAVVVSLADKFSRGVAHVHEAERGDHKADHAACDAHEEVRKRKASHVPNTGSSAGSSHTGAWYSEV